MVEIAPCQSWPLFETHKKYILQFVLLNSGSLLGIELTFWSGDKLHS